MLELLLEDSMSENDAVARSQIEEAVIRIITENQNDDRETGLGEVGSRLVKMYPDLMCGGMGTAFCPDSLSLSPS